MKVFVKSASSTNWQVGKEDKVIDPFHTLTDIFEMSEEYFFSHFAECANVKNERGYQESWLSIARNLAAPQPEYNEFYAISTLLERLPANVDLQLANSLTIRMAHMVEINPNIRVNCNRGVNGIDGSMSTAVGFAADNDRLTFYVTGDLSFFYDMNSLWIRHLSSKMRIMLINNGGGGVMYMPLNEEKRKTLPAHVAAGHTLSAKGWVESLGFKYMSAHTKEEVDSGVKELLIENSDCPIFLEVFTVINPDDISAMGTYMSLIDRRTDMEKAASKLKGVAKRILRK